MLVTLTVAEFLAEENHEARSLLAEYAAECRLAGLPEPAPHREIYEMLEQSGAFELIGYQYEGQLVGFVALLVSMNPHYSVILGATESLFVSARYRKTGAGLALLREAQRIARAKGAAGLLVSAPAGGALAEVLDSSKDWDYVNRVFLKVL